MTRSRRIRSKLTAVLGVAFLLFAMAALASPASPVITAVSVVGLQVDSASAHTGSSPAVGPMTYHPWENNGCTGVPNSAWGIYSFGHACQHHDGCYEGAWASRYGCDSKFRSDMMASCRWQHSAWSWRRYACYSAANTYYLGVRAFGGWFYNNGNVSVPLS